MYVWLDSMKSDSFSLNYNQTKLTKQKTHNIITTDFEAKDLNLEIEIPLPIQEYFQLTDLLGMLLLFKNSLQKKQSI